MKNNYLIVVDMQNDFIYGSLGTEEAKAIVPNVVKRIREAKEAGWNIYLTQDTHNEDYFQTKEGQKLPIQHCIFGTEGHDLEANVERALAGCTNIYFKTTFGSVRLARDILSSVRENCDKEKEANIELLGLCTDVCVVSNAMLLKAYLPEANITVNAACSAGTTPAMHQAALDVMRSCHIDII